MVFIIAIDGNIGAGKSTVLDILHVAYGYTVHPEPVGDWMEMLKRFYDNPTRWSFCLQAQILLGLSNMHADIRSTGANDNIVLVERSPVSTLVFIDNLVKRGHLEAVEADVLMAIHEKLGWCPDATLLLGTSPQVCYDHVRSRLRDGEEHIELAYLEALDRIYRSRFPPRINATRWISPSTSPHATAEHIHRHVRELYAVGRHHGNPVTPGKHPRGSMSHATADAGTPVPCPP